MVKHQLIRHIESRHKTTRPLVYHHTSHPVENGTRTNIKKINFIHIVAHIIAFFFLRKSDTYSNNFGTGVMWRTTWCLQHVSCRLQRGHSKISYLYNSKWKTKKKCNLILYGDLKTLSLHKYGPLYYSCRPAKGFPAKCKKRKKVKKSFNAKVIVRTFKSRWHIECEWQKSRAEIICRKNRRASFGVRRPFFTR